MRRQPATWRWGEELEVLSECLDRGGILAVPTESSYGLAVDPLSPAGIEALLRCKGRPSEKALPVILGELDQLNRLGADIEAPEIGELASLWPAPLTLVVPIRQPIPASGGERSLAVRIPAHARLRSLLLDLDRPLTATSANLAGEPPVCEPGLLADLLQGPSAVIVDDGPLAGGPPSTIVRVEGSGYRVLREGALSHDWLQSRLRRPVFSAGAAEIPADESPNHR